MFYEFSYTFSFPDSLKNRKDKYFTTHSEYFYITWDSLYYNNLTYYIKLLNNYYKYLYFTYPDCFGDNITIYNSPISVEETPKENNDNKIPIS